MSDITFRPVDASAFPRWRAECAAGLAQELVTAGEAAPEAAETAAASLLEALMPQGRDTPGHHVLVAEEDGRRVGTLWLALKPETATVHVFDLRVEEELRSLGYGRAIMDLTEQWARDRGVTALTLDLFTANTVARGLYLSMGYATTHERMRRSLV